MSLAIANTLNASETGSCGGLFIIHPTRRCQLLAPLLQTHITSNITHISTQTTLEQHYQFPHHFLGDHRLIHARYEFPLDENSAVCAFSAKVNNTLIIGECKEKRAARAEYQRAVAVHQTAVLLEQKAANIFTIDLGAIDSGSQVLITLTYISHCDTEGRNTIRFNIPQTVAPRYQPTFVPNPLTAMINDRNDLWNDDPNTHDVAYNAVALTINVLMPVPILGIRSASHVITTTATSNKRAVVTMAVSGENSHSNVQLLRSDIVILIECEANALDLPRAIIERHTNNPQSVAVQVAFTPRSLSLYEQQGNFKAASLPSPSVPDAIRAQTELVFIMDRSGSMSGASMKALKATMQLILRSLNNTCLFNLVGFGDHYDTLFSSSQVYNDNTLELATKYINHMEANFGGTEMFLPINYILSQNNNNNDNNDNNDNNNHISRQIFLLTDGQITDINQLVQLVSKHIGRSRVFTFGIGNEVDRELCKRVSVAGRGQCEFVSGNTDGDMAAKVIRQLQRALQPALTDVSIDWNTYKYTLNDHYSFMQTPTIIPAIFANTRTVVYALNATIPTTSPYPPLIIKYRMNGREEEVAVPMEDVTYNGTHIHALAARARLSELEYAEDSRAAAKEGTAIALKYSLASQWTSFVAVDKDNRSRLQATRIDDEERFEELEQQSFTKRRSSGGSRGGFGGSIRSRQMPQTAAFGSAPSGGVECGELLGAISDHTQLRKVQMDELMALDESPAQLHYSKASAPRSFFPVNALKSVIAAFSPAKPPPPPPAVSASASPAVFLCSSSALPVSTPPPAPAPGPGPAARNHSDVYSKIIQSQKANGLWQANQNNIDLINQISNNNNNQLLTLQKLQEISEKYNILNKDYAITIIILFILKTKYNDKEIEWSLLSLKAENYIKISPNINDRIIENISNEFI